MINAPLKVSLLVSFQDELGSFEGEVWCTWAWIQTTSTEHPPSIPSSNFNYSDSGRCDCFPTSHAPTSVHTIDQFPSHPFHPPPLTLPSSRCLPSKLPPSSSSNSPRAFQLTSPRSASFLRLSFFRLGKAEDLPLRLHPGDLRGAHGSPGRATAPALEDLLRSTATARRGKKRLTTSRRDDEGEEKSI